MDHLQQDILRVYDAIADQSLWAEIMDRFVERVGAKGSIIFEWDDVNGQKQLTAPLHSGFYTQDTLRAYLQKCAHLEARDQQIIRQHTGKSDSIEVIDDSVLATKRGPLVKQEHFLKLQKLGIYRRAAGVLNKDNQWLSLLTIQFGPDRQSQAAEEHNYMSTLLPHIAKAHDLALPFRQIASINQSILAATDRLCVGLCVLDNQGRIVHRNEEFRRQQTEYNAFGSTADGQLKMSCPTAQKQFESLMADVRHHGQYSARPRKEAIATTQSSFLCIELTPLDRAEEIGSLPLKGYVLYSTDTSQPIKCNPAAMKQAFGLTPAELTVVECIGEGLTNPEIALQRERSVETINSQVKSVLAKSQCSTRTQLVRLMMRFSGNFLLH